jgi:hypothetical protein
MLKILTVAATLWPAELQLKKQFYYIHMHSRNLDLRKLIQSQNKFLTLCFQETEYHKSGLKATYCNSWWTYKK